MSARSEHPPPPPKKKNKKSQVPALTTISALGDELIREIFLRLPSLPTLVRAALTCRGFLRAVRSSPAFRRRFRELHPPPILGVFLDIYDDDEVLPAFAPVRRRSDPDHAAAVRGIDVFLTRLPDDGERNYDDDDYYDYDYEEDNDGDEPGWSMSECRDGYAVLINWNTKQLAVYDPLTGALHLLPVPPDEIYKRRQVEFHVFSFEEDHGSFRVVCVSSDGLAAAVLSSDTSKWQIFPLNEDVGLQAEGGHYWPHTGTLVNGSVYRTFANGTNVFVLNITTLQCSQIDLPLCVSGTDSFKIGETKDGKLCLVYASELTLVVWVWRSGDDCINRWMRVKRFRLHNAISEIPQHCSDECLTLKVVGIMGGIVYLSTDSSDPRCWFLSFCLENEELNKLCCVTQSVHYYPYIMAWPNSFVHNKVNPLLEEA